MHILQRIVEEKKIEINQKKILFPLNELKKQVENTMKSSHNFVFSKAIKRLPDEEIKLIAEIKKASPIKGLLKDYSVEDMAEIYVKYGADAISVITEEKFFLGSTEYIKKIKSKYPDIPILRKDFIIDEYQVYESKALGADAVLLIANILDFDQTTTLYNLALELGMEVLFEVHDEDDLNKALYAKANIIGINNRDLKTFNINIENTIRLKALIPDNKIVVSESGISTRNDVKKLLKNEIDAILVGTSIVLSDNPGKKIKELKGN